MTLYSVQQILDEVRQQEHREVVITCPPQYFTHRYQSLFPRALPRGASASRLRTRMMLLAIASGVWVKL